MSLPGLVEIHGYDGVLIGVNIEVHGCPAPQGSKKAAGMTRTGRVIMRESSRRVGPWREAVKAVVLAVTDGATLFPSGPLELIATFRFDRPKAHYGSGRNATVLRADAPHFRAYPPDVEKVVRSTMDALTDSGVIKDDGQFARVKATKTFVEAHESQGASLFVMTLDDHNLSAV